MDNVKHPPHYTSHPSGIECIDITKYMGFTLGNAMKYIWRADLKNGIEDLEKAAEYLRIEIESRREYISKNDQADNKKLDADHKQGGNKHVPLIVPKQYDAVYEHCPTDYKP